jgi:hypothetical protein
VLEEFINMQKLYGALIRIVDIIGQFVFANSFFTGLALIICFMAEAIRNPAGYINFYFCNFIDTIADIMPSTPSQYQISEIITDFVVSYPFVGLGVLMQVLKGLFGILGIYIVAKMITFVRG